MNAFHIVASTGVYRDYNLGVGLGSNPFIAALFAATQEGGDIGIKSALRRKLKAYFTAISPKTIYEYLDLERSDAPGLSVCEPWTAPLPWSESSVSQDLLAMTQSLVFEAQRYGFYLNANDGCSWCGTVSAEKLELETNRYFSVYESIRRNGFQVGKAWNNAIKVNALVAEHGSCCLLLADGAHRYAACVAAGLADIPYTILRFVHRAEASSWPNVRSGLYTESGALRLFDRYFQGEPTSILKLYAASLVEKPMLLLHDDVKVDQAMCQAHDSSETGLSEIMSSVNKTYTISKSHLNTFTIMPKNTTNITLAVRSRYRKTVAKIARAWTKRTKKKSAPGSLISHDPVGDSYYGNAVLEFEKNRENNAYWKAEAAYMQATLASLSGIRAVLDVACGTGRFLPLYNNHNFEITCLDSSFEMLDQIKTKLDAKTSTEVRMIQANADTLPFKDNEFDLVVCFRFLSWIVPAETAISCIREIARTTARYAIVEMCVNECEADEAIVSSETLWNKLTKKSTIELLNQCGLQFVGSQQLVDLPDHPGLTAFLCTKIKLRSYE